MAAIIGYIRSVHSVPNKSMHFRLNSARPQTRYRMALSASLLESRDFSGSAADPPPQEERVQAEEMLELERVGSAACGGAGTDQLF